VKNSAVLVYLGIVVTALVLFAVFDTNVNLQEAKAEDSTRMSRINMLNAECMENIRLCEAAQSAGVGAEISVKAVKIFIKYAGKNISFGSESAGLWKDFLDSALAEGLSNAVTDSIKLKKDELGKKAEVFTGLKALMDKAIDNGYNFEF